MTDPTPTMLEPGSLMSDEDQFCLQNLTTHLLLKYVWAGIHLPTNYDMLAWRTGLVNITDPQLKTAIDDVLLEYTNIKDHSMKFKNETYPAVVGLADGVYNYAELAGTTEENSYYAMIVTRYAALCNELSKPVSSQDPAAIAKLQSDTKALVAECVTEIGKLETAAAAVNTQLSQYLEDTKLDEENLNVSQGKLQTMLKLDKQSMDDLQRSIDDSRVKVKSLQDDYEHDVIVAATTASYVWIWPFGTIAAGIVAGVYGDKAVDTKHEIDAVNQIIRDNQQELENDKRLVAQINCASTSVTDIQALIGPAITVIETMVSAWRTIAADLTSIDEWTQNKSTHGSAFIQELNISKLVEKWTKLQVKADQYRSSAYVTKVGVVTLTEASNTLSVEIAES